MDSGASACLEAPGWLELSAACRAERARDYLRFSKKSLRLSGDYAQIFKSTEDYNSVSLVDTRYIPKAIELTFPRPFPDFESSVWHHLQSPLSQRRGTMSLHLMKE